MDDGETKNYTLLGRNFPIVCIGGSAGGLDAYTRLLDELRSDMGVAVVIINHLRHVATMLDEILPYHTAMPVQLITDRPFCLITFSSFPQSGISIFSTVNSV
jgi:chemotaxis response regulator CheB